ncbi:MAG: SusD/RagB family nutrient-binding outer membrane lipoprotein [Tannerella sp.]|nr:SusD/RagB family nutrient-binding outer membrane lipoprotein [Tannerella sp.]
MKKIRIYSLIWAVASLLFSSCTDGFDSINTDPNKSSTATASTLATSLLGNMMTYKIDPETSLEREWMTDYFLVKMVVYAGDQNGAQYNIFNSDYFMNGFATGRVTNVGYEGLRNIPKMLDLSTADARSTYEGFAKFLKAYHLYYITCFYGDIPYSEALQGEAGMLVPKYDTQKEVFVQILDDLDAAYDLLSKASKPLGGDFVYNASNNLKNWQKVVNSFELNVLITLSAKVDDPELRVKERFAQIVSSRPLFESNADNLALTFSASSPKLYYVLNEPKRGTAAQYMYLSEYFVNMLRNYDDYRLFAYAAPAAPKLTEGVAADSYEAYVGINHTLPFNEVQEQSERGSHLNRRYTDDANKTGEPHAKLGYAQLNFVLAEAAARGWISGSASDYYKKGIRAGLEFTAANTPAQYNNGRTINEAYITSHLANPVLQLTGNPESDIEKIIEQKYIASFLQYQRDTYLDYRRTGYPRLPINPSTSLNLVTDKMQVRIKYPSGELSYNQANLTEAVQRQFNGFDDENQLMWLLK